MKKLLLILVLIAFTLGSFLSVTEAASPVPKAPPAVKGKSLGVKAAKKPAKKVKKKKGKKGRKKKGKKKKGRKKSKKSAPSAKK